MADTESILASAVAHPLNSRYAVRSGSVDFRGFAEVWRGVGSAAAAALAEGRGVTLPGLGDVTLLRTAPTRVYGEAPAARSPVFVLDAAFAQQYRQRAVAALPLNCIERGPHAQTVSWTGDGVMRGTVTPHPLSFTDLAARLQMPVAAVQNAYQLVLRALGEQARNGAARLSMEPLGVLECVRGRCQLRFSKHYCNARGLQPQHQTPLSRAAGPAGTTSVETMQWQKEDPRSHSTASESRQGRRSVLSHRPRDSPPPAATSRGQPAAAKERRGPDIRVAWQDEDDEVSRANLRTKTMVSPSRNRDPYALSKGRASASSIEISDGSSSPSAAKGSSPQPVGRLSLPQGAPSPRSSPTQESWGSGLHLSMEQLASVRRMCRLLDVFNALDRSQCGSIKAHDLSVGFPTLFGIEVGGSDTQTLIEFLNQGQSERASLMEFVRGFQFHERLAIVEPTLRMHFAEFSQGQPIMVQGEPVSGIYIMQSGSALVEVQDRVVYRYSKPGEYFGDVEGNGFCTATVRAVSATACVRVTTEKFQHDNAETAAEEPLIARHKAQRGSAHSGMTTPERGMWQNSAGNMRKGKLRAQQVADPHELLRAVPFFSAMPVSLTRALAAVMKLKSLPKKRWLSREGDFGDGMVLVAEGVVDVLKPGVLESQCETLRLADTSIQELRTGGFLGEMSLCLRERNTNSVRTRVPTKFFFLATADFEVCLQKHPAWRLAFSFLVQQRRLVNLRGKSRVPSVFKRLAPSICDPMISVRVNRSQGRLHGVTTWQLRSLSRDILFGWTDEDLDWLLAGGSQSEFKPDPSTQLHFNDPKQMLDYNRVLIGVAQLEQAADKQAQVSSWNHWHREWSDEHQSWYYTQSTPRGKTRVTQWKPPPGSPWDAPGGSKLPMPSVTARQDPERAAGVTDANQAEERLRSTSPWTVPGPSGSPGWLRRIRNHVEANSINVKVLLRNFDADNSGTIDIDELRSGLARIGIHLNEQEFLELLEMVDPDGAGEIEIDPLAYMMKEEEFAVVARADRDEYVDWKRATFARLRSWISAADLTWPQAFHKFRCKGQPHLGPEEFYDAIRKGDSSLSSWQMDELFHLVNTEQDGKISLAEWLYCFDNKVRPPDWDDKVFDKLKQSMQRKGISMSDLMRRLDTDRDNKLSVSELARGIMAVEPSFSHSDAMELARMTDSGKSGVVNKQLLSFRLTGQEPVVADWEDEILKKIRKQMLASNTPQEIQGVFAKFDMDGSGSLDANEFRRGIQSLGLGLTIGQIDKLRRIVDLDGDGEISLDEFVTRFLMRQELPPDEVDFIKQTLQMCVFDRGITWRKLFDSMDDNRSGLLSVEELKGGLLRIPGLVKRTGMNENTIEKLFILADPNDDGYLAFEEFVKFFAKAGRESIVPEDTPPDEADGMQSPSIDKQVTPGLQKLRDRIYQQNLSILEVFRSFDVDSDGFVSREEFVTGFDGSSRAVTMSLGDMTLLGLSSAEVCSIYDSMPGAHRDFVDFDAFRQVVEGDKPSVGWDDDVVKETHKYMHQRALNVEQTFRQWNYRQDGMLDAVQFSKGLRMAGIHLSANLYEQLFKQMDDDDDGIVNMDNFRKRFNFLTTSWDWKENALQLLAEQLVSDHPSMDVAFRFFMERSQQLSLRPLNWRNFQRYFADIDEVLQLQLRPFEWKELFHVIDKDDDGVLNREDFVSSFSGFGSTGRITPVHGATKVTLSSAEVFRRADKQCDGFLDFADFKVALRLIRPQTQEDEYAVFWNHVDCEKQGRVDIEQFCQRMAVPPPELDWEGALIEDVLTLLDGKRDALLRVFQDFDDDSSKVILKHEFRECMKRLGLGLSTKKSDILFDRVDVAKDGAIDVREFVAWIKGASMKGPTQTCLKLKRAMHFNLGSAENGFLWFVKKNKLRDGCLALTPAQFRTGIAALAELTPPSTGLRAGISDGELDDLFKRCGGRNGRLNMSEFLEYFDDAEDGTNLRFEDRLPVSVLFIALHARRVITLLTKCAKDGLTVSCENFRSSLQNEGFGGFAQESLTLTQREWAKLMLLADPAKEGKIRYRNFIGRCRLRHDSYQTRNTRRRDSKRRDRALATTAPVESSADGETIPARPVSTSMVNTSMYARDAVFEKKIARVPLVIQPVL